MSAIIQEFKPSAGLRPYVELFWQGDFNIHAQSLLAQKVVPNGYLEFIFHLTDRRCEPLQDSLYSSTPDYMVMGLFSRAFEIRFKGLVKVFCIRFKPEGIYPFFGVPASEFREHFVDVGEFAGAAFTEYGDRLREAGSAAEMVSLSEGYLLKLLHHSRHRLYYLNRAAEMLRQSNGLVSIKQLADTASISKRQLEREFKSKLGLSPKQYGRIAKLNEVNRLISNGHEADMASLSYLCGYADQAHFIKDFKEFTGERPTVFLKARDREGNR
jgi:AraC-like DNA-binding protein